MASFLFAQEFEQGKEFPEGFNNDLANIFSQLLIFWSHQLIKVRINLTKIINIVHWYELQYQIEYAPDHVSLTWIMGSDEVTKSAEYSWQVW